MLEVLGEMALDPRQVGQILRLAVPLVEPRENAQNFGRALRAHCSVGRSESAGSKPGSAAERPRT